MNINIQYQNVSPKWKNYRMYIKPIINHAHKVLNDKRLKQSFSIILIDDLTMKELNTQYRDIHRSTDVLTFIDEFEEDYLGDIFINVKAVEDQAKEYGHTKKREFSFLVTHGILHLLGYDHQTKDQELEMFTLQERILDEIAPRSQ
ncbi:MAG TPA: rRNA maturation RNase YbeY [Erysipelothrix sp.]|jgi:probable rRNA maturation factor|nr:rRNA maturation RNase YbeY [Erysipelothrix sp.]